MYRFAKKLEKFHFKNCLGLHFCWSIENRIASQNSFQPPPITCRKCFVYFWSLRINFDFVTFQTNLSFFIELIFVTLFWKETREEVDQLVKNKLPIVTASLLKKLIANIVNYFFSSPFVCL